MFDIPNRLRARTYNATLLLYACSHRLHARTYHYATLLLCCLPTQAARKYVHYTMQLLLCCLPTQAARKYIQYTMQHSCPHRLHARTYNIQCNTLVVLFAHAGCAQVRTLQCNILVYIGCTQGHTIYNATLLLCCLPTQAARKYKTEDVVNDTPLPEFKVGSASCLGMHCVVFMFALV
jgi:hypothetical protein